MSEYFFRRYRNGERMAEDVRITQAATLEEATLAASRIAAQYRDGTVLVSECEVDLRAEVEVKNAALEKMDSDARWRISDLEHDLTDMRLRAEHAENKRDELRELLKKARPYVYGKTISDRELEEEIDALLNKGGGK